MARTFIVSDRHNTFFTENNIKVGTQIPTEGTYRKGDIVVNIGNNTANEAMWICVEAGTPGTWEVVGAGVGGTGGGSSLVVLNESMFVNEPVNEVSLGSLVGKISNKDKLIVHHNSIHLMEGIDYEVDSEGTKIVKLTEGPWNESGEDNSLFSFELLKNVESIDGNEIVVDTKLTSMVNNVIVNTPTTEVEIGIDGFNKDNDTLLVFKNGVIMVEGVEYNVSGDNTKIISINEVWNESNVENYGITFVVFKEVVIYNGENGSITMDMLGNDVKDTINGLITITELNASNIDKNIEAISKIDLSNYATKEDLENVDLSNYATKEDLENVDVDLSPYQEKNDVGLVTTDKTIVGAINELFQNANNGKELIASAIGEPLDSNDTFSAMSNDINSLLSTFKTNMMNNGITVESGDKFKALIDKIATMVEEGSGKGIQYASGGSTLNLQGYEYKEETTPFTETTTISVEFSPSLVFVSLDGFDYVPFFGNKRTVEAFSINLNSEQHTTNTRFYHKSSHTWGSGSYSIYLYLYINNIKNGFNIVSDLSCGSGGITSTIPFKWYAIGVGEEDTTLRDSLASILQEEGVSVTEEDNMASLISKVDSEFDRQVVPAGDVVAGYVVEGKTFMNSTGQVLTGTMTEHGVYTDYAGYFTTTDENMYLGVKPGAYLLPSGSGYPEIMVPKSIVNNLSPENIVSGKEILGVWGTASTTSYVSGSDSTYRSTPGKQIVERVTIQTNLGFVPSNLIVRFKSNSSYGYEMQYFTVCSALNTNKATGVFFNMGISAWFYLENVNANSFDIVSEVSNQNYKMNYSEIQWMAYK